MKILGTENHRNGNSKFSLYVVDELNSEFSVLVKSSLWLGVDNYKKNVFTNGIIEKTNIRKGSKYCKITFNVHEGDWLVVVDLYNNVSMYINEQYCGPVKIRNKKIQEMLDYEYNQCRERINSKREFAKRMGTISRKLNLPFSIVLAFKGDEELLIQLEDNINKAIENEWYKNNFLIMSLRSKDFRENSRGIQYFGITRVPEYQSEKIANYLYDCLEARRVIRRYE